MAVVLSLPEELRASLKEPFGPIYRDADALLDAAGEPVVAVGDMVTYHLLAADRIPDVAVIDGKTERAPVEERIRDAIEGFAVRVEVENPPATLTEELLRALRAALARQDSTVIVVTDGEEDLAAVPAIVAAPTGAAVVYGQPGEGMVLATVEEDLRDEMRSLLDQMAGDHAAAAAALEVQIG